MHAGWKYSIGAHAQLQTQRAQDTHSYVTAGDHGKDGIHLHVPNMCSFSWDWREGVCLPNLQQGLWGQMHSLLLFLLSIDARPAGGFKPSTSPRALRAL